MSGQDAEGEGRVQASTIELYHLIGSPAETKKSTRPAFRLAVEPDEQEAFDNAGFDGLSGSGISVEISKSSSLHIAYRGTQMYCWLVRGYRGYAKPPAVLVFMPTNIITRLDGRNPVILTWKTMPWDEGLIVVAGIGELSGAAVMSLIDCIYEEYKSDGVSDHLVGRGIKRWQSLPEGSEALNRCRIILTTNAIAQWRLDSETELRHSQHSPVQQDRE